MAKSAELLVEREGDDIVVTLPGTLFKATYRRRSPGIDRISFSRSDLSAPIPLREFITCADAAANAKARELGWII